VNYIAKEEKRRAETYLFAVGDGGEVRVTVSG
jgi:hypothetical protein